MLRLSRMNYLRYSLTMCCFLCSFICCCVACCCVACCCVTLQVMLGGVGGGSDVPRSSEKNVTKATGLDYSLEIDLRRPRHFLSSAPSHESNKRKMDNTKKKWRSGMKPYQTVKSLIFQRYLKLFRIKSLQKHPIPPLNRIYSIRLRRHPPRKHFNFV